MRSKEALGATPRALRWRSYRVRKPLRQAAVKCVALPGNCLMEAILQRLAARQRLRSWIRRVIRRRPGRESALEVRMEGGACGARRTFEETSGGSHEPPALLYPSGHHHPGTPRGAPVPRFSVFTIYEPGAYPPVEGADTAGLCKRPPSGSAPTAQHCSWPLVITSWHRCSTE